MAAISRAAQVFWHGDLAAGGGALSTESGALEGMAVTYPRRVGEPDGHTSPEELIAGAHAACFAMSLAAALTKAGGTVEQLSVRAEVSLDRRDGTLVLTESVLTVHGQVSGVEPDGFDVVVAEADARCPVSNALRATAQVRIDTDLKPVQ